MSAAGTDLATQGQMTLIPLAVPGSALSLAPKLRAALDEAEGMPLDSLPILEPAEAAEAQTALDAYTEALAGCDTSEIERMMGRLAIIPFGMNNTNARLTEEEEDVRLKIYVKLLKDIPFDILSEAFAIVCKTCKFYPTPADIRGAADKALHRRRCVAFDLNRLMYRHRRDWREPIIRDPMTQAEVDEANELFRKCGIATRFTVDGITDAAGIGEEAIDASVNPDEPALPL